MQHRILIILTLLLTPPILHAQLSIDDVRPIFPLISEEKFAESYAMAGELLKKVDGMDEEDVPSIAGIVRYIRLLSGAALVAEESMTWDEFEPMAKQMEGKFIMMAAHPTLPDDETNWGFNRNIIRIENDTGKVTNNASNEEGTTILAFEYFNLSELPDLDNLVGKVTRCGGTLSQVEFNPNHSTIWIMRLRVNNAQIVLWEPPPPSSDDASGDQ